MYEIEEEEEEAVANQSDGQPSIQEVSNGPFGSTGQRSRSPFVPCNTQEGTLVSNLANHSKYLCLLSLT